MPVRCAAFSRGVQAVPISGVMVDPANRRMTMTIWSAIRVTICSCVKGAHRASVGRNYLQGVESLDVAITSQNSPLKKVV